MIWNTAKRMAGLGRAEDDRRKGSNCMRTVLPSMWKGGGPNSKAKLFFSAGRRQRMSQGSGLVKLV